MKGHDKNLDVMKGLNMTREMTTKLDVMKGHDNEK